MPSDTGSQEKPLPEIPGVPGVPLPGAGVHADYLARDHAPGLPLLEVLAWTEADRQKHLAGTAFMRMKLPMLKRNALIALGNASRDTSQNEQAEAWRATIESHANDPDPLVAQTAIDVLANLAKPNG